MNCSESSLQLRNSGRRAFARSLCRDSRRPPGRILAGLILAVALVLTRQASPQEQAGQALERPEYELQIPSDLRALPDHTSEVEVPLLFEHNGKGRPGVFLIGLDYEELLLQFRPNGWSLDDCAGTDVVVESHDVRAGYLELRVEFDPLLGVGEKVPLVKLYFGVTLIASDTPPSEQYDFKAHARLRIDPERTTLLTDKSRSEAPVIRTLDGNVTIFTRDHVEVGSAIISPDAQIIVLPVSVTHVRPSLSRFALNLDYFHKYLQLVDVTAADPIVSHIDWHDKVESHGANPAHLEAVFQGGIFPAMTRTHLVDLHFAYDPAWGLPSRGHVAIEASLDDAARQLDSDLVESSPQIEIESGTVYFQTRRFVRGDVDVSGSVDTADVLSLLEASFLSGRETLACLAAADADASGEIDISDPIYLLTHLYAGGEPPHAPFPTPGPDPAGVDGLGCDRYGPPRAEVLPSGD